MHVRHTHAGDVGLYAGDVGEYLCSERARKGKTSAEENRCSGGQRMLTLVMLGCSCEATSTVKMRPICKNAGQNDAHPGDCGEYAGDALDGSTLGDATAGLKLYLQYVWSRCTADR